MKLSEDPKASESDYQPGRRLRDGCDGNEFEHVWANIRRLTQIVSVSDDLASVVDVCSCLKQPLAKIVYERTQKNGLRID